MKLTNAEITLLKGLAVKLAEIASRPEQVEKRRLWIKHNELRGERPMFLADQLPWNELEPLANIPVIGDHYWGGVEKWMRREIWKAENLSTDMVVENYVKLPYPVLNSGWGLEAKRTMKLLDETSDVASQHMECLINEPEDIEKIHTPQLSVDSDRLADIEETAPLIFDGIMPWKYTGLTMHLGAWDTIAFWMSVTNCYLELMDRPEMMHELMEKMTQGYLGMIEQVNRLGLCDTADNYCHCSHTYRSDDNPDGPKVTGNGWAFGLAQLFTSVSPAVTRDFECAYMQRIFPHFKHIYYGCCDRLDDRMEYVSALPNVRKISCSPWSEREAFAEKLPKTIVMSNKPTPAVLAGDSFDEEAVRSDIRRSIKAARDYGKTLEMIIKDVSTVRYDTSRLIRFCEIATEEITR